MKRILLLMVATLSVSFAQAGEIKSYSDETLRMAKAAGSTVVLDFHADWCPVCRRQEKALGPLTEMAGFEKVVVLKVDYDKEKELRQRLKVAKQGTLVVFKGETEAARAVGVTDPEELKALIGRGL